MELIVEPPLTVGPLTIGMPIVDAERLLHGISGALSGTPGVRPNRGFVHFESEMSIQIAPDRLGRLRSVEIYRPVRDVQVLYRRTSVFETPAEELIRILSREVRLEIEDDGLRVIAPDLLIAFGRDMLEVGSDGAEGLYFDSMLIAVPGYYDEYEPEVWPSAEVRKVGKPALHVGDDGQESLF
jgi:hypothetical protein